MLCNFPSSICCNQLDISYNSTSREIVAIYYTIYMILTIFISSCTYIFKTICQFSMTLRDCALVKMCLKLQ